MIVESLHNRPLKGLRGSFPVGRGSHVRCRCHTKAENPRDWRRDGPGPTGGSEPAGARSPDTWRLQVSCSPVAGDQELLSARSFGGFRPLNRWNLQTESHPAGQHGSTLNQDDLLLIQVCISITNINIRLLTQTENTFYRCQDIKLHRKHTLL